MSFSGKALSLHNSYRTLHGSTPLQWSSQLESEASEYAKQLANDNLPLKSKRGIAWGQNLFEVRSEGGVVDGADAVEKAVTSWYGSIKEYNVGTDSYPSVVPSGPSLSFTQLVWKGTQRLGLGVALSSSKERAVVVAFYDPPGNCSGEFATNVQKLTVSEVTTGSGVTQCPATALDNLSISETTTKTCNQSESGNSREVRHTIEVTTTTTSSTSRVEDSKQSTGQTSAENKNVITSNTDSSSVTVSSTADVDATMSPAESKALEVHNELRRKHGVGPVRLDKKLCEAASVHANALLGGNKALGHVGLVGLGQNVFQRTGLGAPSSQGLDPSAKIVQEAIESWYSHQKEYNWDHPNASGKFAGLFAQLVWKSTQMMGVGVARRGDLTIVVCVYSEAGNVADEKIHKENVFKVST